MRIMGYQHELLSPCSDLRLIAAELEQQVKSAANLNSKVTIVLLI